MKSEEEKVRKAVEEFTEALKERLYDKVRQGFKGWDKEEVVTDDELVCKAAQKLLEFESTTRNMVDVAAFSMFLWYRESRIRGRR